MFRNDACLCLSFNLIGFQTSLHSKKERQAVHCVVVSKIKTPAFPFLARLQEAKDIISKGLPTFCTSIVSQNNKPFKQNQFSKFSLTKNQSFLFVYYYVMSYLIFMILT
jgi:hypothetical protein